ncbi:MAG: DUF928 domain-containing protein [Cyanobacteria bacterium P01_A01_bin.83]
MTNAREQSNSYSPSSKRPPPPRRIPPNKVKPGGGLDFTRQACLEDTKSLVALTPINNPVTTTKSYPSFLFYIPDQASNMEYGEFSLLSADDKSRVYHTQVKFKNTPGIIKIDLPSESQYALKEGEIYHWYFRIFCQQNTDISASLDIDGWIQRIPLTPSREKMIEAASTDIWYDSLVFTVNNLLDFPQNSQTQNNWRQLLLHINLEYLVDAPIVETLKEY